MIPGLPIQSSVTAIQDFLVLFELKNNLFIGIVLSFHYKW